MDLPPESGAGSNRSSGACSRHVDDRRGVGDAGQLRRNAWNTRCVGSRHLARGARRVYDPAEPVPTPTAARSPFGVHPPGGRCALPPLTTEGCSMTDGLIVAAGAGFLCVFGVALLVYYIFLRLLLRAQYAVLSARIPGAIITPCSAALVTRLALRRIGEATGNSFGSTGPVYSVAAYPGHLRVLRGKSAVVVAEFGQEEISDVRVGTTSFLLADFTTLFVGIRAAGTTFELPIRVNGPHSTSIYTARRDWAAERGNSMLKHIGAPT